jgi:hypothetical protein
MPTRPAGRPRAVRDVTGTQTPAQEAAAAAMAITEQARRAPGPASRTSGCTGVRGRGDARLAPDSGQRTARTAARSRTTGAQWGMTGKPRITGRAGSTGVRAGGTTRRGGPRAPIGPRGAIRVATRAPLAGRPASGAIPAPGPMEPRAIRPRGIDSRCQPTTGGMTGTRGPIGTVTRIAGMTLRSMTASNGRAAPPPARIHGRAASRATRAPGRPRPTAVTTPPAIARGAAPAGGPISRALTNSGPAPDGAPAPARPT